MAKKRGGLVDRIMLGKEKSDDYARSTLPSNRWELFWDIFKGRIGKLVVINIMTLLFFLPVIAVIFIYNMSISGYGALGPFNQPFGVPYQVAPSFAGFFETISLNVGVMILTFTPIAVLIAGLGLAGASYVIRNMIWTEGIFVANDYFKGIKQNFLSVTLIAVIYSVFLVFSFILLTIINKAIAMGTGVVWLMHVFKYLVIIVAVFFSIFAFHMISMTVNYKMKAKHLIKNCFLFSTSLLLPNIFFFAISMLPFILVFIGGYALMIGLLIVIFLGFSFALLVWMNYCQWCYDSFINPKIKGAKKNRGIYDKVSKNDSEAVKRYKEALILSQMSSLGHKPVKPITDDELQLAELPASFNRADLERVQESHQAILDDNEKYVKEHQGDPEYVIEEMPLEFVKEDEAKNKELEKIRKELAKSNKKKKK